MDIKPNNFLVGNPDDSIIYIIDFGLSRKYRSSRTGKHTQFIINKSFDGNIKYCSANIMRGIEPSRRDDLESIGYMLIFLYTEKLPWSNVNAKTIDELNAKVYKIKMLTSIKSLCENVPNEMEDFMKHIKSLGFKEEPKYNYLTKILEMMLKKINHINDLRFSWIRKPLIDNNNKTDYKRGIRQRKISPFSKIFEEINKKNKSEKKKYNKLGLDNFKRNILNEKENKNLFIKEIMIERHNNYKKIKNSLSFERNDVENKSFMNNSLSLSTINNTKITMKNKIESNEIKIKHLSVSNIQFKNKPKSKNDNINYWKKKIDITKCNKNDNDLDVEYNFLIDYKKLFPVSNQ